MRIGDYDLRTAIRTPHGMRYEATHRFLPRRAVLEVSGTRTGARAEAVRLLKQACLVDALHHPAIPRVYECGTHDGQPWVAFERVEGVPLAVELRAGALDLDDLLEILDGVAGALAHAHLRGVLHRDITPASILVRAIGRACPVVLGDWTSACTFDTELRVPLRGAERFRAPEIVEDDVLDGRADVFALGTVAREALAAIGDPHHDELSALLARMTATERFERPSAAEVRAEVRMFRSARLVDHAEPVVAQERTRKLRWTPQIPTEPVTSPPLPPRTRTRPRG